MDPISGTGQLRVLLVEDDESFAELVAAQLAQPGSLLARVEVATDMAQALEVLHEREFDVVLLDLGLPDETGLRSVKRILERAGSAAVIVVTGHEEPFMAVQALSLGAQEYVLKREITAPLLERTVRYAIERRELAVALEAAQERERSERELRRLERLSSDSSTETTAELFGQGALSGRAPHRWTQMKHEYGRILERALEERSLKLEREATRDLRSLAQVLGFLGATPKDVVKLHTAVLNEAVSGAEHRRAEAYVDEGRLAVLELMGHLVTWYRARAATSVLTRMEEA